MKFDEQYWRGFLGGLRWIVNHICLPWDVFRDIKKKERQIRKKLTDEKAH